MSACAFIVSLLLITQPASASASIDDQIEQAIKLFNGFEDAKATIILKDVLAESPNPNQAALAHLYLGLLAFSALKHDLAHDEFKQALHSDPSVDMPFDASAKARIAFEQARADLRAEIVKPPEPTTPTTPPRIEAPPPKVSPPVKPRAPPKLAAPPEERSRHRDLVAAYVLGGTGLGVVGGSCILGALSDSARNSANQQATVRQGSSLASTAGTEGLLADIGFAAGGLAAAVGLTLIIIEATGGDGDGDSVVIQPTGRGFSVRF